MNSVVRPAKQGLATKLHRVLFGDTSIEYEVRRSRRRKKTVHIRVDGNGVHVAAPMRTPNHALEGMVLKRASWILDCLSRVSETAALMRFVSGETLPYLGRSVRLIVETDGVASPEVRFDRWRFRVAVPQSLDEAERYDAIQRAIAEWYKARAEERMRVCVELWWPVLGSGEMPRVLIRDPRRQWGSCAPDGTLRFSWRLMMVEPALTEYVVVHELAHLTHRNHSADFWALVSSVMPDARHRRKRLDEAGRLLPTL